MSYKRLKLKLRVSLAGHTVGMATYCAKKLTATCSRMIGQFVDTMILASTDEGWLVMTHQTLSLGKYWKLFPTSLTQYKLFIGDDKKNTLFGGTFSFNAMPPFLNSSSLKRVFEKLRWMVGLIVDKKLRFQIFSGLA